MSTNEYPSLLIKDKFKKIHNDYCNYINHFQKKLDSLDEELTPDEFKNLVEWLREYNDSIEYTKNCLDRFGPDFEKSNEICSEVKNKVIMPLAIMYWVALNNI